MKKNYLALTAIFLFFTNLTVVLGQLTSLGTIPDLNSNYDAKKRIMVSKNEEKFAYNDYEDVIIYNLDGTIWKKVTPAKQSKCAATPNLSEILTKPISTNSAMEYCFRCNYDNTNEFVNFGIADDKNNLIAYIGEKAKEYKITKSGFFTFENNFYNADTARTIRFYKNENNSLVLKKTFKTRYVGEVEMTQPNKPVYYFEITNKANEIIFYNDNFDVLKKVKITLPQNITYASIQDLSQKSFNTNDNWEFIMSSSYFVGQGSISGNGMELLDDTGKSFGLNSFSSANGFNYSLKGNRFIQTSYDSLTSKYVDIMYELPSKKKIGIVPKGSYASISPLSGKIYMTTETTTTSTISDETNKALRLVNKQKENISGYNLSGTYLFEMPDTSLAVVISYYNTNKYASRLILPNGKKQDFIDYYSINLDLGNANTGLPTRIYTIQRPSNIIIDTYQWYDYKSVVGTKQETQELKGVSISPNPIQDVLNIQLPTSDKEKKISIFSTTGQQLFTTSTFENTLILNNFNNFPSGLLLLEVENEGKKITTKLMKI